MPKKRVGRKSSFIWNFYDADADEKARCRLCARIFSRKGCCTSGLITHLKTKHTERFLLYLNKGMVNLEGAEIDDMKKEPVENDSIKNANKKVKQRATSDEVDESVSENSVELPEDEEQPRKPIEQLCLQEEEYPIINIARKIEKEHTLEPATSSQAATTQIESLLTKQLQIQAKLYKEMKEKLDQISAHLKESERINRKSFRLKVEKLRLQKEDLKRKELHRKEMHRLRLLELEILNKKNVQQHLHYDQL